MAALCSVVGDDAIGESFDKVDTVVDVASIFEKSRFKTFGVFGSVFVSMFGLTFASISTFLIPFSPFSLGTFGVTTFGDSTFGDKTFGVKMFGDTTFGVNTFDDKTFSDETFDVKTFGVPTFCDTTFSDAI